ncbi:MAG: glycosyltransferase [Clostridia bacterium]|nr:glycosyltransferase [Clostridia bacterium]
MKILITTDLFTVRTNGVVTSTHNLIYALKKQGHEVRVLTFSEDKTSRKEDGVYYIKSKSLEKIYHDVRKPASRARDYVDELVEWHPDVIHSQCEFYSLKFAKRIAKRTHAPIVHTYHTLYEDYVGYVIPFKRIGRWVVRHIITKAWLKRVHTIIAPTVKVRDNLVDRCKVKNNVEVIPSGICLDRHKIKISDEARREGRAKWGFSDDSFVLINLGRLGNEKNIEELISYFAKVSDKYPNARLFIVGGGPAEAKLKKLAEELNVTDKVVFAGMVTPESVSEYYQLGDLFVCASQSETQGLTYIEAAANRLPLLCRDDPCFEGVVLEGENGFRYTDFDGYAEKLDYIINNSEWVESASRKSEEISLLFDREVFGESVASLYKRAIGDNHKELAKVHT